MTVFNSFGRWWWWSISIKINKNRKKNRTQVFFLPLMCQISKLHKFGVLYGHFFDAEYQVVHLEFVQRANFDLLSPSSRFHHFIVANELDRNHLQIEERRKKNRIKFSIWKVWPFLSNIKSENCWSSNAYEMSLTMGIIQFQMQTRTIIHNGLKMVTNPMSVAVNFHLTVVWHILNLSFVQTRTHIHISAGNLL